MPRKRPAHRQRQKQKQELVPQQVADPALQEGRVLARFGAMLDVEDDNGSIHRCNSRRKFGPVVCGDRVIWRAARTGEGVIEQRLPRTTLLTRPDDSGRDKAIAANISRVIVVATVKGLTQEPYHLNRNLIDRYLVAAELLGITPVIVINKIDLLAPEEHQRLALETEPYCTVGYAVIHTSTKHEHGLDILRHILQDQVSVLVGESGTGKSSIIRALLQDSQIRVGAVSAGSGKGKHTTTTTTLYHLPDGGDLIDSPGVREFGLSNIDAPQLAANFIEFRPYIGRCRFHNCRHDAEPQCAVKRAVDEGNISTQRYRSYLEILTSLAPRPGT